MQTIEKTAQCGNSRRGFLRHLAVAPALAAAALPAAGAASLSSGLPDVIEAHRIAWDVMDRAGEAYSQAEAAAPEPPLVRSARGAYALSLGRETVLARINDDYRYCLDNLRLSVGKMIPDRDLRALEAAIEQRKADSIAAAERAFAEAESSAEAVAERIWVDAACAEQRAFMAVLACPCRTMEEVTEKARYVLDSDYLQNGGGLEEDEVEALLRSMTAAVSA